MKGVVMIIQTSLNLVRALRFLQVKHWTIALVVLIILGLWISPVAALNQVSDKTGQPEGTPGPISTLVDDQILPKVAYNSQLNEYLAVWEEVIRDFDHDIYAIRVNGQGIPIGIELMVGISANMDTHPEVAYSPMKNEYLVVWENEYSLTDHDILAQRVAADGTLVGGIIYVAYTTQYDMKPVVTYNPNTQEYLVVYERRVGSDEFAQQDLYGQLVYEDGTPIGNGFAIATGLLDEQNAAVACDGLNYLVVWQGDYNVETNIYGQRIEYDGVLIGDQIGISTWEDDQLVPRITYDSDDGHYFVVWEDHHFSPWEIYGQSLDTNGNLVGNQVGVALGGSNNRTDPNVAYMSSSRSYLVVWQFEYSTTDHDIYGRRIAYDGSHPETEYVITNSGAEEKLPAVVSNGGSQGLVVWEDWRNYANTGVDIYGSEESVNIPTLSGVVYEGDIGDPSTPLPGVEMELGCSSSQGYFGDLIGLTYTNDQGEYQLPAYILCEYYNILETDPAGYFSVGAQTSGGEVLSSSWIYYVPPLSGKVLSGNLFCDKPQGPGDTTPPGNWTNFQPPDWVNTQTVNASEQLEDTQSGLDVSTAEYQYSIDGGGSWSGWLPASITGYDGITTPQVISASVPFGRDSGPDSQNLVSFRVSDMAGNLGTGPQHAVKVDSVPPVNPTSISSPTHTPNIWSNNPNITFNWSGASDDRSGIYGYSTSFDQSPNTIPDIYRDTADASIVENAYLDTSTWWFHVRTIDTAGNAAPGAVHYGPFAIDTDPPTAWFTSQGGNVNYPTVTVAWAGGDTLSGVYSYDVQTNTNAGGWTDWQVNTQAQSAQFIGKGGQDVYFRVRAHDIAGNIGDWSNTIFFSFGVDITAKVQDEWGGNLFGAKVFHNDTYLGVSNPDGTILVPDALLGDTLTALYLVYTAPAGKPDHSLDSNISWGWRVYITNVNIPNDGTPQPFKVTDTNIIQLLTVRKSQALIGAHMIIVVGWDTSSAYLEDLRQGVYNASNFLYDLSDGQYFFDTVEIFDNAHNGPANDMYIYTDNRVWPNAFIGAIEDVKGRMMFPPVFRGLWSAKSAYGVIIHEFGHYGLHLFDEYLQRDGSNGGVCTYNRGTNPADEPTRATIMDNPDDASELCAKFDPIHGHSYYTLQDKENNGESDWQTVLRVYKDSNNPTRWTLQSPDTRGVAVVAGPTALPTNTWMKVYVTDYDTQVCAPFDTQVNASNGAPVKDAEVSVEPPAGEVKIQGITDSSGRITVRGAHNGDTLRVKIGSDSANSPITCTPGSLDEQSVTSPQAIILNPDPFTLTINILPLSENTVQVQVEPSVALPVPPQARIWQDLSSVGIDVPLIFDSGLGKYVGQATLDPALDLQGYIHVTATDSQAAEVVRTVTFSLQAVNPGGTTKLTSSDGQMEIYLPAGSLVGNPVVSILPASQVSPQQGTMNVIGSAYTVLTSNGETVLQQTAVLNINFSLNQLKPQQNEVLGLYQWDEANAIWVLVSTDINLERNFISAHITRLGMFAIMAPPLHFILMPIISK